MKDINLFKDVTLSQLKNALNIHKKELKLIRSMNNAQYAAFRKNFSVGINEPSREKAIKILESMIAMNLKMQSEITKKRLK